MAAEDKLSCLGQLCIRLPFQGRREGMSWRSQNENYGSFNDVRFERTNVKRIPEYGAKDAQLEQRQKKLPTTTANYGSFYKPSSQVWLEIFTHF